MAPPVGDLLESRAGYATCRGDGDLKWGGRCATSRQVVSGTAPDRLRSTPFTILERFHAACSGRTEPVEAQAGEAPRPAPPARRSPPPTRLCRAGGSETAERSAQGSVLPSFFRQFPSRIGGVAVRGGRRDDGSARLAAVSWPQPGWRVFGHRACRLVAGGWTPPRLDQAGRPGLQWPGRHGRSRDSVPSSRERRSD